MVDWFGLLMVALLILLLPVAVWCYRHPRRSYYDIKLEEFIREQNERVERGNNG